MDYEIAYQTEAQNDLDEILNHLFQYYPGTPKKFDAAFHKMLDRLRYDPHFAHYEWWPAFRKVNVGDYIVLYTVDEESRLVTIHHVRHGMRSPYQP